jgi:hypothetical protein
VSGTLAAPDEGDEHEQRQRRLPATYPLARLLAEDLLARDPAVVVDEVDPGVENVKAARV